MIEKAWDGNWEKTRDSAVARLRRLRRDRENGLFLGVCAGVAESLGTDVVAVRIVAALALWFYTVPTLVLYAALGVLLPERGLCFRGARDERAFWRGDAAGAARRRPGAGVGRSR
jgi:phage shock protein C